MGFIIVCYYTVIMAWCLQYLLYAFQPGAVAAWATDPAGFFYKAHLNFDADAFAQTHGLSTGGIQWPVVAALAVCWVIVFLLIFRGVKQVGKVVLLTVPLPILLVGVLLVRGLTLPNMTEGLAYYLQPDFDLLRQPEVWLAAYGQIFFSLSVGFGVMVAYASYLDRKADITNSAFMTGLINCGFSFFAGFAVFSVLGFLAWHQALPALQPAVSSAASAMVPLVSTGGPADALVSGVGRAGLEAGWGQVDVMAGVSQGGPGLAFIAYPSALAKLPLPWLFGVLFFLTLLTLGIDSAFSIVEGVVAAVVEKFEIRRVAALAVVCGLGFAGGLIYCTGNGLIYLDTTDHFINFGMVMGALGLCIVVGWFLGARKMRTYINRVSEIRLGRWWDVIITAVAPAILIWIVITNVLSTLQHGYEGYHPAVLFWAGWAPLLGTLVLSTLMMAVRSKFGWVTTASMIKVLIWLAIVIAGVYLYPRYPEVVMAGFGCIFLYGGLWYCVHRARKAKRAAQDAQAGHPRDVPPEAEGQ